MPAQKRSRRLGSLLALLFTVALAAVIYTQRQAIYDYSRLYNYQAPDKVAAIATATTMTDKAKHVFYVNRPELQGKDSFNQSCPDNGGEQTIVLGCYQSPQAGIYLFKVDDPELKGVEEVTAAHEMLHGVYDRLSTSERQRIDGLLQDYYVNLQDERLKTIFEAYKKSEPNDLPNEMHSIFGTEVANLPPALESYYKQYFSDRQKVVMFASQYQGAFSSRKDAIAQYDAQLQSLKISIEASQTQLEDQSQSITTQRQELNRLLANGDTASYNSQVDSFNAKVRQYNASLAEVKLQINQYNDVVEKRNALAVETQNLAQQLNSRLQTQTAQ
ncbi:MAG: hypothetical protein ABIQ89_02215 [Candidatus Saccharimonadales bacterium]